MLVLITGAAQGIGAAYAKRLSTEHDLVLVDLNANGLAEIASQLGGNVTTIAGDLTKPEFIDELAQKVLERFGHLDVLINNAGVTHKPKPTTDITLSEFDLNFNVNVKAPFLLMQKFLPEMQEQRSGIIVNMASTANIRGYKDLSVYAATKAAISALTDTVALENVDNGIKAVAIMPGRTNTPMQVQVRGEEVAKSSQSPDFLADVVAKVISGEIPTKNGDDIRIWNNQYVVEENIYDKELE